MAGPALDPKKVSEFERGFNGQDTGPGMWDKIKAALFGGGDNPSSQAAPVDSPSPGADGAQSLDPVGDEIKRRYPQE